MAAHRTGGRLPHPVLKNREKGLSGFVLQKVPDLVFTILKILVSKNLFVVRVTRPRIHSGSERFDQVIDQRLIFLVTDSLKSRALGGMCRRVSDRLKEGFRACFIVRQ